MEQTQYGYWLPPNYSTHGAGVDQLISVLHWFMLILFVVWGIYLVYCLIAFRERPGHEADIHLKHFSLPTYAEIGIVIIEAGLLIFFSYPVWARVKNDFPKEEDALHIKILAEQFAWNIHYPGADKKFGATKVELIDGTNPVGLDSTDPAAKDDLVTTNQLVIPVNKPIIADLGSKDVIHSFFLPVMRVKQDTFPGMEIPVWFEATHTGEFQIGCAQLCGVGHYRMLGQFHVKEAAEYETWFKNEWAAMNPDAGGK